MVAPTGADRPARRPLRAQLPDRGAATPRYFQWRVVAVVLFLALLALYSWLWLIEGKPVGVAVIAMPLLFLLSAPLFAFASRNETRFDIGGLLATGLALRFAATYYRFTNASDGATYHLAGSELAKSYRQLNFNADPVFPVPGTGGMRIIAGVAEVFTNSNEFATFLLFAWLGFLGCYFVYRAFVTALPNADHRRYALLVMLWPTVLFWPSSIGKDCWLLFTIGIAALGASRVLVRRPGGYLLLGLGLFAGSFVRPHVTLLFLLAFAAALLIGRRQNTRGALTPSSVAKVAGLVVLLALGAVLATRTATLLNANDISGASIDLSGRTGLGGSAFSAPNPQNPVGYVIAVFTVLFRPLLFEAHGTDMIATSFEGLFLLGLCVSSWRRLLSIPRRLRPEPYTLLALAFVLVFILAFGSVSNFGILARERSVMMPFFFVLLSVYPAEVRRRAKPKDAAPRGQRPSHRAR